MTDSGDCATDESGSIGGSGNFWEYKTPDGAYVYHTTDRDNVQSIRKRGLRRDVPPGPDTDTIAKVLQENGYGDRFPFDRNDSVYCHVDWRYVTEIQMSPLMPDEVIIVVAVEAIEAPTYLANMAIASDLIGYQHGGPGVMIHANTLEEAISKYEESTERVDSPSDIASNLGVANEHLEIVIDGDVPPTAIADICDLDHERVCRHY